MKESALSLIFSSDIIALPQESVAKQTVQTVQNDDSNV
jgi:hypothetical protein